jgi:DNA invertase Pin-like site-specific DNA recombinase
MIYGYARVSMEAQDLTGSTAQLKTAGCQKIFRDEITGTTADRPQLQKLMAALPHGDVVIIPAVDRLSRDTTHLLIIAREMQRAGAGIRSLAEPFLNTTSDSRAAQTPRPKSSNSGASRSSPRPSSAKRSSGATWTAKRCVQ